MPPLPSPVLNSVFPITSLEEKRYLVSIRVSLLFRFLFLLKTVPILIEASASSAVSAYCTTASSALIAVPIISVPVAHADNSYISCDKLILLLLTPALIDTYI